MGLTALLVDGEIHELRGDSESPFPPGGCCFVPEPPHLSQHPDLYTTVELHLQIVENAGFDMLASKAAVTSYLISTPSDLGRGPITDILRCKVPPHAPVLVSSEFGPCGGVNVANE